MVQRPLRRVPLLTRPAAIALSLALALGSISGGPLAAQSALEPATTGGLQAVDRALAKLSTHRRLLVIAAHPDDEDTSLIALVSRGMGGEAAYLSLSRGEGGQNLIGSELGVALGLLRSRELLAARNVDGGRQFFTRAYDFGYTRSLEETSKLWPKEMMVEDAVRIIRRFKPQVVVSVFPGVPHPNHGQHQMAGVTAYAAFPLAGDASALSQLAAEGLTPWTPQALYRSTFFDRDATSITMSTAGVDPLAGKSIYQLAMASRSMHRSQDMGQIQRLGPQETRVGWVQGGAGKEAKNLFDGIDTRLSAIVATLPDGEPRRKAAEQLTAAQAAAERTRAALSPEKLGESVPGLVEILQHLHAVRDLLGQGGIDAAELPVVELIDEKIGVAEAGLAAAAGIALDATTDREAIVDGETFAIQASLWNSGGEPLQGATVALVPSPDWAGQQLPSDVKELAAGALGSWELKPTVPAAPPTIPYFLRRPLQGSVYDWSAAPADQRGEPFGPPPYTVRFRFKLRGLPVTLAREVVHLHRDQALGEVRRPLRVVPAVEVAVADDLLVWPIARREPQALHVALTSHGKEPLKGKLEATIGEVQGGEGGGAPAAWPAIAPQPFELREEGEPVDVALTLTPPKALKPGPVLVRVVAVLDSGERFSLAVPLVDYPHVRATARPRAAEIRVQAADLRWPKLLRVGYVRGASDRVPEFLRQAGLPLEILGPRDLAEGDLKRFDAIVVGSRAYEVDEALERANHRLLDYVREGGLVIVQYQQYPFVDGKFAPLPFDIARPHDRVTDETAEVKVLDANHPVFQVPNRIGPADWEGWIQERGLYFAHSWDPGYTPLLAMADPGGPELKGGLLVAKLGKGTYVYSGLAFFRQLPAGVPGAYRLFANLLALAKPPAIPAAKAAAKPAAKPGVKK
jgi:LmbE family N-acetylglucosaminyl deacetylase